jgi:hypothetical protein
MPRLALAAIAVALWLALPAPAAGAVAWAWPVRGAVLRSFFYDPAAPFLRGQRRGVELAAPSGSPVRAACGGRVATARPGWVVTLRCGPWRVTHLPMAAVSVHVGAHVAPGARLGTLGTRHGHPGLHLGVRRAGDPFAYVDPLAFLPPDHAPRLAPLPPASGRRRVPVGAAPRLSPRGPVAAPRLTPPRVAAPRLALPARRRPAPRAPVGAPRLVAPAGRVRVPDAGGLAPWPAWAGLALALAGGFGGGVGWRRRARRARATTATRAGRLVAGR